jgi:hypothetical protein
MFGFSAASAEAVRDIANRNVGFMGGRVVVVGPLGKPTRDKPLPLTALPIHGNCR